MEKGSKNGCEKKSLETKKGSQWPPFLISLRRCNYAIIPATTENTVTNAITTQKIPNPLTEESNIWFNNESFSSLKSLLTMTSFL